MIALILIAGTFASAGVALHLAAEDRKHESKD
jgi:hypothetical protein